MADLISQVSMTGGSSEGVDIDCGSPYSGPNTATDTRALTVLLVVNALSGGMTPAVTLTTNRLEQDSVGNPTGVVTAIDSPAGLTTTGVVSRTIGPNQAQAATLARRARISVAVTGGPTACQWSLTATATR